MQRLAPGLPPVAVPAVNALCTRATMPCPFCGLELLRVAQVREHLRIQHHLPDDFLPLWMYDVPYANAPHSINDNIYPHTSSRWDPPPIARPV